VCFDFQKGMCARGEACRFSHASSSAPARAGVSRAPLPCFEMINKGACSRADSCRFSHDAQVLGQDQRRGSEWAGTRAPRRTRPPGSPSPERRRSRSRR
jgi:hypothetical protein